MNLKFDFIGFIWKYKSWSRAGFFTNVEKPVDETKVSLNCSFVILPLGISENSNKVWTWYFHIALLYKLELLANFPSWWEISQVKDSTLTPLLLWVRRPFPVNLH